MHIIGFMFFSLILLFAIGVIGSTMIDYRDRIISALVGDVVATDAPIILISHRPRRMRTAAMISVSNGGLTLPLAA